MKRLISIVSAFLMIAAMITIISATEVTFTKKYVDSNQFTYVTQAVKQTNSDTAAVKITNMYKEDGSDSNYWRFYVRPTLTGGQYLIQKDKWYDLRIPATMQNAGTTVQLYAMGHDPSLDCRVSGYWNVH